MQIVSKNQAISLIKKSIDESTRLSATSDKAAWTTWERNVRVRIEGIYGVRSPHAMEVYSKLNVVASYSSSSIKESTARLLIAILWSFLVEIEEFWSDTGTQSLATAADEIRETRTTSKSTSNRVFVVHGHDHGRMQAIARFLEHLGLEPIILHERPSSGDTVIEKLERHSDASYAIVLLTPDDIGAAVTERNTLNSRARQNVILELGYFLARLGRTRTAALVVPGVEIPSDYSGIVYISINKGDEWKLLLARELRAAGLGIDMNKVI